MRYLMLLMMLALVGPAFAELKIVTTTTEFADVARRLGGDRVSVHSVMKGPENVHNVLAAPPEMLKLSKADLFVHGGLDAEPWRDNFVKGARNPRIAPGKPGNVDMSDGIALKEVPQGRIDRSMGDIHAFGNPHYQLDPRNAARMSVTLLKAMVAADPANAEFYKENARGFVREMTDLHKELSEKLKAVAPVKVVTFHPAWLYFADAFGLEVVGTIEPKPAITPSPAELKATIEAMKRQNVKVVIVETYNSYEQAKSVAEAAGAKLLLLPDHVNGVAEAKDYTALFRYDVEKIVEAVGGAK